jgi:hypothetical protein
LLQAKLDRLQIGPLRLSGWLQLDGRLTARGPKTDRRKHEARDKRSRQELPVHGFVPCDLGIMDKISGDLPPAPAASGHHRIAARRRFVSTATTVFDGRSRNKEKLTGIRQSLPS